MIFYVSPSVISCSILRETTGTLGYNLRVSLMTHSKYFILLNSETRVGVDLCCKIPCTSS